MRIRCRIHILNPEPTQIIAILAFILYEIWWYGVVTWLVFIAVAFCSARFWGCFGVMLGVVLIAAILLVLDARWIFDEMNNHPENGRDADFVFMIGVLLRVVVFNFLLLPVSLLGLRWFRRRTVRLTA